MICGATPKICSTQHQEAPDCVTAPRELIRGCITRLAHEGDASVPVCAVIAVCAETHDSPVCVTAPTSLIRNYFNDKMVAGAVYVGAAYVTGAAAIVDAAGAA